MTDHRIHTDATPCAFTRRSFCIQAGGTVSLVALSTLLPGCSSPTSPSGSAPALTTISGSVSGSSVSVPIDAASALATVGGAALVQTPSAMYLVARTGQNAFTALTAICTHEGCTITGFKDATYVCPCHGSQYTTSGTVVIGPATTALRQFATQFANNTLTIAI